MKIKVTVSSFVGSPTSTHIREIKAETPMDALKQSIPYHSAWVFETREGKATATSHGLMMRVEVEEINE